MLKGTTSRSVASLDSGEYEVMPRQFCCSRAIEICVKWTQSAVSVFMGMKGLNPDLLRKRRLDSLR